MLFGKIFGLFYDGFSLYSLATALFALLCLIALRIIQIHRKIKFHMTYNFFTILYHSMLFKYIIMHSGHVVELVDTLGLEPSGASRRVRFPPCLPILLMVS